MTNLPATISTLTQQIGELTKQLAPASQDQVSKSIRTMLAAGLALPSAMKAEEAPDIYNYALEGVPAYGVNVATRKIIRGEYDINKAFIPTPPELAAIARAEARVIREDKARLVDRLATISGTAPKEKRDPAAAARIRALHKTFKQEHAAAKAISEIPQDPISDEKAQYLQKIMALRDASEVTAEQAAFRRKIASDLAAREGDERQEAAE